MNILILLIYLLSQPSKGGGAGTGDFMNIMSVSTSEICIVGLAARETIKCDVRVVSVEENCSIFIVY